MALLKNIIYTKCRLINLKSGSDLLYNIYIKKRKRDEIMKRVLLKRLHEILIEIAKTDDKGLEKIGVELLEIEKHLMTWVPDRMHLGIGEQ